MNKLLAIEIAVVVSGLLLAIWHPLAAVTWFAGYVVGYRKRMAAESDAPKGGR